MTAKPLSEEDITNPANTLDFGDYGRYYTEERLKELLVELKRKSEMGLISGNVKFPNCVHWSHIEELFGPVCPKEEKPTYEMCAHSVSLDLPCDICEGKLVCPICKEKTELYEHREHDATEEIYYCSKCHSDFHRNDMVRK